MSGGAPSAAGTFFRSRWVEAPAGVEELDPAELAPGFRAGTAACGLKGGGKTDVGVVACDADSVASAVLLTRNAAAAAPIRVCREDVDRDGVRAVVVNAGNANAATGEQGYADALAMRDATAAELGVEPRSVAVAETGVIGVPLQIDAVLGGIAAASAALSRDGGDRFAEAIMTTDKGPKRCAVRAGGVTVSAQAKGAGMTQPGFATMLCFIQTDAVVDDPDRALRAAVAPSFERITVDGQMSTNDTVVLQATGEAGAPLPEGLLEAVLPAARARDRRRRRGGEPGRANRGARRTRRRGGRAGRADDRQLAAGQDRPPRPRPELGPDRAGSRDGARRRGPRRRRS